MPGNPEYNNPNHEWRAPKPQTDKQAFPLVPFLREQRGEGERSHEEIVASIREDMAAYVSRKDPYNFDPVAWIRHHFICRSTDLLNAEHPELVGKLERHEIPHARLLMAWDIISQPYYKDEHHRGLAEACVQRDAEHLGHTITLEPNEGKLLSAMAEAVGIPNPFGPMPPQKK